MFRLSSASVFIFLMSRRFFFSFFSCLRIEIKNRTRKNTAIPAIPESIYSIIFELGKLKVTQKNQEVLRKTVIDLLNFEFNSSQVIVVRLGWS